MRTTDLLSAAIVLGGGVVAGVIIGGSVAIAIGLTVGMALATAVIALRVRPLVAISLVIGGVAGLFVGSSVIQVLCLPDQCPGLEAFGGAVTAVGAVVGVGVVVALATRSFDEYHEAVEAGRPPPEPGCETDVNGST